MRKNSQLRKIWRKGAKIPWKYWVEIKTTLENFGITKGKSVTCIALRSTYNRSDVLSWHCHQSESSIVLYMLWGDCFDGWGENRRKLIFPGFSVFPLSPGWHLSQQSLPQPSYTARILSHEQQSGPLDQWRASATQVGATPQSLCAFQSPLPAPCRLCACSLIASTENAALDALGWGGVSGNAGEEDMKVDVPLQLHVFSNLLFSSLLLLLGM